MPGLCCFPVTPKTAGIPDARRVPALVVIRHCLSFVEILT
jgi:hypothetical protein